MSTVTITWQEHLQTRLRKNAFFVVPDEPFVSTLDVSYADILTGEEAAQAIIAKHAEVFPDQWCESDYTIEILAPEAIKGVYLVELIHTIEARATELDEGELLAELEREPEIDALLTEIEKARAA